MTDARVAKRFRLALDMYEFGEQMVRSALRRHHPHASAEQITQMLWDWRQADRARQKAIAPGDRPADSGERP